MNNRKIVFFDIDGTIYRFDTGMPKDTYEAIKLLKAKGHIPVICTGRTRCMIYKEHMTPGFRDIVAGAGTYVEIDGKELYCNTINNNEARRVIDGFVRNGFVPVAEGRDNIYIGRDISDLTETTKHVYNVYRESMGDFILSTDESEINVSKVSALFTNHSNPEGMIKEFENDYTIISHQHSLLELVPKGYNKAVGIEKLIKALNIPWENTYAFGDSLNDIDMLKYVKYGCAMGNSDDAIKEATKYHTSDFDKGGIYEALKKFELI